MAPLDDFKEKVEAAIDQAKPFVEGAMSAGEQIAAKADEWASSERPGLEGAFEAAGGAASGAVDLIADGANAVYEFIKDKAEELSGQDVDGDGQIGKIKPEDVEAGVELAVEAVAGAVDKAATDLVGVSPGDVVAGAELAAEAVAGAVDKAAAGLASVTSEDVEAGAELAAEAVAGAVDKAATELVGVSPGDVVAGAELIAEAVEDAVNKATEAQ